MSPGLPLEILSRGKNSQILGYMEKLLNQGEKKDISSLKFNSLMEMLHCLLAIVSGQGHLIQHVHFLMKLNAMTMTICLLGPRHLQQRIRALEVTKQKRKQLQPRGPYNRTSIFLIIFLLF